jgi:hypothetical protein
MDFLKEAAGKFSQGSTDQTDNSNKSQGQQQQSSSSSGGGFLSGIGDKLNSAAGGGRESEKNEDYLDK